MAPSGYAWARSRSTWWARWLGLVALAACGTSSDTREPVRIAAAADLSAAFAELGPVFEGATGERVSFTFGSSGLLARQLVAGAPYDAFFAANDAFVDQVVAAGACPGRTKARYARGRIVLWWRGASRVAPPRTLADLADPRFARIALANPEHAPYGAAARQALESVGLWERLRPRVVLAENVRQALTLAETGNVEIAFVALSVALASRDGASLAIDERLHRPLDQAFAVCRRGRNAAGARAFARFLASPEGRDRMVRFGFALPGEPIVRAP